MSSIASGTGDLVFCGDFNLDLLKVNEDSQSREFYQLMNSYSLLPIISKPSRVTDSSFTLIDNFFVSNLNHFTSGMFCVDITDHYPIFLVYNDYLRPVDDIPDRVTYRMVNENSLDELYNGLLQEDLTRVLELDIDESVELLDQIIMENFNRYCPVKTKYVSPKDKKKPWITSEIKSKIKEKNFHYRLLKYNSITIEVYNRIRNEVTSLIRRSKADYHDRLFDRFKNNMKKTWHSINGILGKNRSKKEIKTILYSSIKKLVMITPKTLLMFLTLTFQLLLKESIAQFLHLGLVVQHLLTFFPIFLARITSRLFLSSRKMYLECSTPLRINLLISRPTQSEY